jgi:hypothetical protein
LATFFARFAQKHPVTLAFAARPEQVGCQRHLQPSKTAESHDRTEIFKNGILKETREET